MVVYCCVFGFLLRLRHRDSRDASISNKRSPRVQLCGCRYVEALSCTARGRRRRCRGDEARGRGSGRSYTPVELPSTCPGWVSHTIDIIIDMCFPVFIFLFPSLLPPLCRSYLLSLIPLTTHFLTSPSFPPHYFTFPLSLTLSVQSITSPSLTLPPSLPPSLPHPPSLTPTTLQPDVTSTSSWEWERRPPPAR